jgi:tetratricopeptide (TPR) repeat protein
VWEKNPVKDFYYFEALGDLYFGSDRKNEAVSIWKNIFIQNPNQNTLQIAVSIFNKKGLANETLNCYLDARKRFGQPLIYHREIFEIYLLQTQNSRAFEELLNLLNYSPDNLPLVISELSEIIKDTKEPDLLIEKTKAEISKNPDSGEFYQLLGEIYLETNQPDLSIPCFEKAGELKKNKEIVLVQLGEKLINKKFYNEAIKTFTKIKDTDLFKPLANYQMALSFYNLGSYDSSANILNEIINGNMPEPYFSQAYALKGEILFETHDLSSAKETLSYIKNLPEQNETKNRALFRLAEVEFLLGNFAEARDQFTKIANNNTFENFSTSAGFYLAEIYFLEDEFEKAKGSFEGYAKRFPSELQANKTLLRLVLLNRNKENEAELKALTNIIRTKNYYKLPEAENNANDFISKNPDSQLLVYFLMELGEIYSLENKWPEALKIYENIQKIDSYFYKQEATKQLASIYETNFKDNAKARAEYIKSLTDFPENPVIEIIRKKIEELKP